ncbi:alpha/beta fold hydrolase [Aldersonia sp. NBC_00410]|uniref:PHA/PHB synthase family protein n=1 Tax=Aldersonia sp. NBC_00410 TaxID=2975954 RepID=UPI002251BB07|nr:alpha/beta fold hydrolase [Aldersonia sp. NBC_00410]MCX5045249.1 alpha/beta fold hydrolase [Aldersonia sp. NBC_00410]
MATSAPKKTTNRPDELAAPLDLLLTGSTRSVAGRMLPSRSWTRMATGLAGKPRTVAGRGTALVRELGSVATGSCTRAPARADKRFADPAWNQNPLLHRTMQAYLATADTANSLLDDAELEWRDQEKMRFVFDNLLEGLSPSNNPFISPLGWKAMIDTGGLSMVRGLSAFARDMASKPRVPAMVEPDAFEVGETVAATKGAVVLRTRVFELIHYVPQTEKVREIPLLMVPPVINKYYITDIAPGRSMIEYYVQQGQQVFTISWRNPQARHRSWDLDTYGAAIIEAMDAVEAITNTDSTHLLASCSGGIIAAMVAAHLASIGEGERVAGLGLAVTVLDQSQAGFASAALSESAAENAIKQSAKKGYLDGRTLAEIFAWLRPTDLVWRYWVNNYVQGRSPAAFDVLFWNADTTRMAAGLHRDMVQLGLQNALTTPGAVSMLGTPIDLATIAADAYVIGGIADHISPWQACYRSARLLGSKDNRFVLSTSGHIAALVNPPGNPKASFRAGQVGEGTPEEWLDTAETSKDSWWPDYVAWLAERSGAEVDAPAALGNAQNPPVAPAPGVYVHQK